MIASHTVTEARKQHEIIQKKSWVFFPSGVSTSTQNLMGSYLQEVAKFNTGINKHTEQLSRSETINKFQLRKSLLGEKKTQKNGPVTFLEAIPKTFMS